MCCMASFAYFSASLGLPRFQLAADIPEYARAKFGSSSAALEKDCNASWILPADCCSMAMLYWCTTSSEAAVNAPPAACSWADSEVVSPNALRSGAASLGMVRRTSSLLAAVASALAMTLPVCASSAVAEMLYLSPRRLSSPVITAPIPWLTATRRAGCSSSLSVGCGSCPASLRALPRLKAFMKLAPSRATLNMGSRVSSKMVSPVWLVKSATRTLTG